VHWLEPEVVTDDGLTPDQVESWRQHGYALVDGLLPVEVTKAAHADALAHFPATPGDGASDFGSGGRFVFPSSSAAVNAITLHPHLLRAVAQLLGTASAGIRLTQSDLWAKYGRATSSGDPLDNHDQRMHVDYPNHTLTHPPPWDAPEAVEMIVYLSDVDECSGATRVVPRQGDGDPAYPWPIVGSPGVAGLQWVNDRSSAERYLAEVSPDVAEFRAEHLYAREAAVRYRHGNVLLYRHDTWHRGTPINAGALRIVMNLTFRLAASEWISTLHEGWSWAMYRSDQTMERLISNASVDQRNVLGFPPPGHSYWTAATRSAVAARYPGIDLDPYR
jgi:Phytanoyl-CoA dioxygenase (PhyH)